MAGRNCIYLSNGLEYAGSVASTKGGEKCLNWTHSKLPSNAKKFIAAQNDILNNTRNNECRNPDNDPNGPWCYDRFQRKSYCDVKYCGK